MPLVVFLVAHIFFDDFLFLLFSGSVVLLIWLLVVLFWCWFGCAVFWKCGSVFVTLEKRK